MTSPDIRERAERLRSEINELELALYGAGRASDAAAVITDFISQALLEAHEAGRAEGVEQAAREGYVAGAKTGIATLGREVATAIRSIK